MVRRRETGPKNHRIRRVDLSHQLRDTLSAMKESRELEAMAKGEEMPEWVFLSPHGHRWDEARLKRGWRHLLAASGLRRIRFHDLRHTFASLLIDEGAHPKYIQEQLGHGSFQMTMDVYGHLFPNRNRGWVDRLDEPGFRGESATQPQPAEDVERLSPHNLSVTV